MTNRKPLQIKVEGAIIELGEPVTFLTLMELARINAAVNKRNQTR